MLKGVLDHWFLHLQNGMGIIVTVSLRQLHQEDQVKLRIYKSFVKYKVL